MQVVQVRSEAQPFNGSFNILVDMRSGVGDCALSGKDVEATFRGNCQTVSIFNLRHTYRQLTY